MLHCIETVLRRIEKYLNQYAQPEAQRAASLPGQWQHALVIPAFNEGSAFVDALIRLDTIKQQEKNLIIVVINATAAAPQDAHEQNMTCAQGIRQHFRAVDHRGLLEGHYLDILLVDRFSPEHLLPPKQGVGLARKIGGDIVAALYHQGKIRSPWFGSTDADAHLPEDYFQRLANDSNLSAITFPFAHVPAPGFETAMALYELSLHHYVLGLHWAQSPYAYHTIGSTIATHVDTYAGVRGFPKRQAGEDFYYLNKAAKLGPVLRADGAPIQLAGRPSSRVPFGTGPAIQHIHASGAPLFYAPEIFKTLRDLLDRFNTNDSVHAYRPVLDPLGYPGLQRHLAQHGRTPKICHDWFDGFKTLKFLHACRNQSHPSVHWHEAISKAPWWTGSLSKTPVQALNEVRAVWQDHICGSTSS